MSNDIAAKIGKLLNKAEGTDNPHEAETYMRKAEALMIQQGISEAMARQAGGGDVRPEEIVERQMRLLVKEPVRTWWPMRGDGMHVCVGPCAANLPASKFPTTKNRGEREVECRACRDDRLRSGDHRISDAVGYNRVHIEGFFEVARAVGLRGYRRGDHLFYVVGHESDADRTVTLLTSLRMQAVASMWRWWRGGASDQFLSGWSEVDAMRAKARRDYLYSFYVGAAARIRSERRSQVDATPGAALAVRDKSAEVDSHMDAKDMKKGRPLNLDVEADGYLAGRTADVGTKAAGGGRTAIGG